MSERVTILFIILVLVRSAKNIMQNITCEHHKKINYNIYYM